MLTFLLRSLVVQMCIEIRVDGIIVVRMNTFDPFRQLVRYFIFLEAKHFFHLAEKKTSLVTAFQSQTPSRFPSIA